jgi:hypothetical protein
MHTNSVDNFKEDELKLKMNQLSSQIFVQSAALDHSRWLVVFPTTSQTG